MRECTRRALRTFVQAAAGYVCTNAVMVFTDTDADAWRAALLGLFGSAIAAGLAALMNLNDDKEGEDA